MSKMRKFQGLGFVAGLIIGSTSAAAAVMHLFLAAPPGPGPSAAVPLTPMVYWLSAITTLLAYSLWLHRRGRRAQSSARDADDMANLDPLTSLQNRRAMLAHIDQMQRSAHGGLCAVLMIDLDRFKAINDALGHAAGDTVLKAAAARIKNLCGPSEHPYRIGGDEFAVLVDSLGDIDGLTRLTGDLAAAIARPISVEGSPVVVECSIGQAVGPARLGVDGLLRAADQDMYHQKHTHHEQAEALWTAAPEARVAGMAR